MKWIGALVVIAVAGYFGLVAYDYFRLGYHTAPPDRPEGSRLYAFDNDRRTIVLREVQALDGNRRYLYSGSTNVPEYLRETWSTCRLPTEGEAAGIAAQGARPGLRLEGVCEVVADAEVFVTGLLYSAPR